MTIKGPCKYKLRYSERRNCRYAPLTVREGRGGKTVNTSDVDTNTDEAVFENPWLGP